MQAYVVLSKHSDNLENTETTKDINYRNNCTLLNSYFQVYSL